MYSLTWLTILEDKNELQVAYIATKVVKCAQSCANLRVDAASVLFHRFVLFPDVSNHRSLFLLDFWRML